MRTDGAPTSSPTAVSRVRPRRRVLPWAIACAALLILSAIYPPIRIVRLTDAATRPTTQPDAGATPEAKLSAALARATDAKVVLDAIRRDPTSVKQKYGREVGIGGPYYLFVAGDAVVVRKDESKISLNLSGGGAAQDADVVLDIGPVFGNAIRDGTGAFDVNASKNSRDFNVLSEQLNQFVETSVLPGLKSKAKVGARVKFASVAEISDEQTDLHPLHLVPVSAEVR